MSERTPQSQNPEQQANDEFFSHEKMAEHFINKYVGNVMPEHAAALMTEESRAASANWRQELLNDVVDQMRNVEAESDADRVKKYEDIIAGLKEYKHQFGQSLDARDIARARTNGEQANPAPAEEQGNPPADDNPTDRIPAQPSPEQGSNPSDPTDDAPRRKISKLAMLAVMPSIGISRVMGYMQKRSEKSMLKRQESSKQREGESDADYERRMRFHKIRGTIADVAFVGMAAGAMVLTKTQNWDNVWHGMTPWHDGPGLWSGGDSGGPMENAPEDKPPLTEAEILEQRDTIIRAETEWFNQNGHEGNDFNKFAPQFDTEGKMTNLDDFHAKLAEQYDKSPRMLASQLDQMQDYNVDFPAELDVLEHREGETDQEYMNRVSEAFYRDPELHDKAAAYTIDFVKEHGQIKELHDYKADYIFKDEYGNVKVNEDNYIANRNGDYVMSLYGADSDAGIRINCLQAAENLPAAPAPVYQAPQGTGGAPVYGGEGGTPPSGSNPPGGEGGTPPTTPEEPPVNPPEEPPVNPPEEPPVNPPEEKKPKPEDKSLWEHIEDALPAEFGGWAPPAQTAPTPPEVTTEIPGQELTPAQPGGQAPEAETPTAEEQQQQQDQAPAAGSDQDGDEAANPWTRN